MYETILFDLDGTLTDPAEGITNSVAYALRKYGIEPPERRELYCFIGPPLADSFRKYYGFSEDEGSKAVEVFREYFRERGIFENVVYDGIDKFLSDLKKAGNTVVLATSKPELFAKQILERFDLMKYFDIVAGATFDETRVKKDDVIAYALEQLGNADLSSTVMVGDRGHDVKGAAVHGIPCIGVLYGYGDREELENAGAKSIAESVEALSKLLLK
ncbi:MAG: HAD family hydrolase [Ruminococcaceae bacterium]|nr:HAD family hydrolase [Oscillospiraceae bacterium]